MSQEGNVEVVVRYTPDDGSVEQRQRIALSGRIGPDGQVTELHEHIVGDIEQWINETVLGPPPQILGVG